MVPQEPGMPKISMKYRSPSSWPLPKRGKARANMKRPASSKLTKFIPYVRNRGVQKRFRKELVRFGRSVQQLLSYRPRALINKLTKDGILPDWSGQTCPHCAVGTLGGLHYFKAKSEWVHKCAFEAARCGFNLMIFTQSSSRVVDRVIHPLANKLLCFVAL